MLYLEVVCLAWDSLLTGVSGYRCGLITRCAHACYGVNTYTDSGEPYLSAVVETYEWMGHHTFFPMAVTTVYSLVLFLTLLALYKRLAPRTDQIREAVASRGMNLSDISVNLEACGM